MLHRFAEKADEYKTTRACEFLFYFAYYVARCVNLAEIAELEMLIWGAVGLGSPSA